MRPHPAFTATVALALLVTGCRSASGTPGWVGSAARADPFSVMEEAERLATRDLWPGFEAASVPTAIYDGTRTLLFRHPSPPAGFRPDSTRDGVWSYAGRHPSMTANSSVPLGGVQTATLLLAGSGVSPRPHARVLIHEQFHVFQRDRHPRWGANEVELFTYPVEDPALLALRRLESEALRRALSAHGPRKRLCWARAASALRRERFAALPPGAVAYERGTEINEGLALYVERRAAGRPDSTLLQTETPAPEAVRRNAYLTGAAIASLLDAVEPGWKDELERNDSLSLDGLLAVHLAAAGERGEACAFSTHVREHALALARRDVSSLVARRAEHRRDLLDEPGWRLIVTAPGVPFLAEGFDPLNVDVIGSGEVLHARYLKLGNEFGAVEVLNHPSLTLSAGSHPLFDGVRTVTVTGLADEPDVLETRDSVTVSAEGVVARLGRATVERSGSSVTVRLPSPD